jgi:rare lipoprotein A
MTHYYPATLRNILLAVILSSLVGCADKIPETTSGPATQRPYTINSTRYYPIPSSYGFVQTGIASWYGPGFHGRTTSNGERYDMQSPTAAHKTLPMNTMVLVKNLENGKETIVRINDRGPFVRGRVIDLSFAAARQLGIVKNGTAKVQVTAMTTSDTKEKIPELSQGSFFVTIASYPNQKEALHLQTRFKNAGHETLIHKDTNHVPEKYLVQIFAGTHLRDAIRVESALYEKGYKDAFIVAN